ncbi:hypothetical protein VitviT2T_017825 [Vitis vinifera]|uniref:Major facilitator superfamily (MFS) profile domain-containing protein n=5 Tax=Vitis vinifera TaxID=29760 RepID=A0ABY9CW62_VITVI|nr:hypothetical protein VitviT2T_017825 [Vitis vinifera]
MPMWAATLVHQPLYVVPKILSPQSNPKLFAYPLIKSKPKCRRFGFRSRSKKLEVSAAKEQLPELHAQKPGAKEVATEEEDGDEGFDLGWLPAFPHVLIASMSNFLFGYHIGVMNGPIVSVARELGFEGNSILEGLVVSIFIGGAFIGSLSSGLLVDKFGCRRTLQIDTIPLILGALISAQAHSLDEILWGRFLVGLGIGVNTVLVPIYISEVAPTKYRGSLGTLCQIGTCLGIIVSLFLGIPSEDDPHWWRTMLYIATIPGFIISLGMQFAVESPRWLCKAGRLNEAKTIIRSLWGVSEVDRAIEEFQAVIKNDGSDLDSNWLELLEEPHSRVAFIGGTLFFLQQFAGINGVLYFSSLTFQDVGITSGALASLFVGVTNFAGALCALYLMDRQGRQRLLIGSYLGMAVSMFLIVYAIISPVDEQLGHNLSILGTLMYIFSFAIGAGPVTGLIIPELSSTQTRGKIMGFSFSVHWVCNFVVGLYFLELVEKLGVAPVYASFGGVSLLSAIFAYYFIVETKGRSLEEIEMSLNRNFPSRDRVRIPSTEMASVETIDSDAPAVELIVCDASSSDSAANSVGSEEIEPLLAVSEKPKINIFSVSYSRRKPREQVTKSAEDASFTQFILWAWSGSRCSGLLCMALSSTIYCIMEALSDIFSAQSIPLFETAFTRCTVTLILSYFWLRRSGQPIFGPTHVRSLLVSRALMGYLSLLSFVYCIQRLPLSQAVVLSFTTPIMASIMARIILHEKLNIAEIGGLACSFIGVLFIFRPILAAQGGLPKAEEANNIYVGGSDHIYAVLVGLVSSISGGISYCLTRAGAKASDQPVITVFAFGMLGSPAAAICTFAFQDFVLPSFYSFFLMVILAVLAFFAEVFLARGLQLEKTSKATNIQYIEAALSQLWGLGSSKIAPSFGRLVGCFLIFASTCCTMYFGPDKEME